MLNKSIIMGRLTRDPELRYTGEGTPVANFTLAVEEDIRNKTTGEKDVDFINVTAWRNAGEFAAKYLTKGRMAVVVGRLKTRTWEDQNKATRREVFINAENVYFGDSERRDNSGQTKDSELISEGFTPVEDDDLPF